MRNFWYHVIGWASNEVAGWSQFRFVESISIGDRTGQGNCGFQFAPTSIKKQVCSIDEITAPPSAARDAAP